MKNEYTSNQIYQIVLDRIDRLSALLDVNGNVKEITKVNANVKKKLESLQLELKKSLHSLKNNSEWEYFTVAFYGETNAGKSSIIETLRIILHEDSKSKERDRFNSLKEDLENCINKKDYYNALKNEKLLEKELTIKKLSSEIDALENELCKIDENSFKTLLLLGENNKKIISEMFSGPLAFLHTVAHKNAYIDTSNSLREQLIKNENNRNSIEKNQETLKDEIIKIEQSFQKESEFINKEITYIDSCITSITDSLKQCRDGNIIGDGKQDYTQTVESYRFNIDDKKILILDLPGIEGKEEKYINDINKALEKAHLVFYISGESTTPQKGENGKGTIEKIKKQLSNQTEVYFVYNKRINNPKQLEGKLCTKEINKSLRDVDRELKNVLGLSYKGHLTISALPAFLAKANSFDSFEKKQEKFCQVFTSNEMLIKSNIHELIELIKRSLNSNYIEKIKSSNYHKIINALNKTIDYLNKYTEDITRLLEKIKNDLTGINQEIYTVSNELKKEYVNAKSTEVFRFKTSSRKILYDYISNGLSDDDLLYKMKDVFEQETEKSIISFNSSVEYKGKEYIANISEILNKFKNFYEEHLAMSMVKSDLFAEYVPEIFVTGEKHGIMEIIGSVLPAILSLLFIKDKKKITIILSVVSAIIAFSKNIAKVFREDNKALQRKNVDENIIAVATKLDSQFDVFLQETNNSIDKMTDDIIRELNNSLIEIENTKYEFSKTIEEIKTIKEVLR